MTPDLTNFNIKYKTAIFNKQEYIAIKDLIKLLETLTLTPDLDFETTFFRLIKNLEQNLSNKPRR
jgi:hypothetical protein